MKNKKFLPLVILVGVVALLGVVLGAIVAMVRVGYAVDQAVAVQDHEFHAQYSL